MAEEEPKIADHWGKILVVLFCLTAYFVIFGLTLGWHRLAEDWLPLDKSVDGPNLLVSFIWLPIAFVGGWIVSEIRAARNLEKHRKMIKEHLDSHLLQMATLVGASDPNVADALNATSADRSLDTP